MDSLPFHVWQNISVHMFVYGTLADLHCMQRRSQRHGKNACSSLPTGAVVARQANDTCTVSFMS